MSELFPKYPELEALHRHQWERLDEMQAFNQQAQTRDEDRFARGAIGNDVVIQRTGERLETYFKVLAASDAEWREKCHALLSSSSLEQVRAGQP